MRMSPARLITRAVRALAQAGALALAMLLLVAVLVALQGQRDETRPASAALVLDAQRGPGDAATQAQLDRALALHRQELVARIILVGGDGSEQSQRYLSARGAIGDTVVIAEPARDLPARLALAVSAARANGASSLIIVAEPWELMRALKITRDLGVGAYGSPARIVARGRTALDDARSIAREAWGYLGYILIGR